MSRVIRIAGRAGLVISLLVIAALVVLRVYSVEGTVMGMAPLSAEKGVLVSAQFGGYWEVTLVDRWPGPKCGVWSGEGWKDVGPFISRTFFREHRVNALNVGYGEGTGMVPLVSPGGPVAYERAEELGYPNTLAWPPDTVVINLWQVHFPFGVAIVLAATVPVALWLARWRAARRSAGRRAAGLCEACGYDLRASEGACPECGRAAL